MKETEEFKEAKEENSEEKFKEIEKEDKDETLEEEIIPNSIEEESFVDFSRGVVSPLLSSNPIPETQPLENELENTPSLKTRESEEVKYEASVYNMPEYSYETEAQPMRRQMHERRLIVSPEEHEVRPRAEVENWHELREIGRERIETSERVVGTEERDRNITMPWEYKHRRRKLI